MLIQFQALLGGTAQVPWQDETSTARSSLLSAPCCRDLSSRNAYVGQALRRTVPHAEGDNS